MNSFGLFRTVDHSGDLSKKFSYNVYLFNAITLGGDANGAVPPGPFYLYGEVGLSYNLSSRWSATASYVHERQNPFRDDYRVENRAFQQLTYEHPFPGRNGSTLRISMSVPFRTEPREKRTSAEGCAI